MMKKGTLISICWLMLVSCGELKGLLKIFSPLVLKQTFGNSVTLAPGSYTSELAIMSRRSKIKMHVVLPGGSSRDFYFNYDQRGSSLPASFYLTASESGQNNDIAGTVNTKKWVGETRREMEDCSYERPVTVCTGGDPRTGGGGCHTEYRTVWGRREAQFRVEYTKNDVSLNFLKEPHTELLIAHFDGSRTDEKRNYDSQGICR